MSYLGYITNSTSKLNRRTGKTPATSNLNESFQKGRKPGMKAVIQPKYPIKKN